MLSPTANPPGTIYKGKNTWQTHATQIEQRQDGLENLKEEWDAQDCGGGGKGVKVIDEAAVREAIDMPVPTPADYWDKFPQAVSFVDASEPGALLRVGAATLGTLAFIGAGILLFVPFDGPAGEYAAGTAGLGLWGFATQ